MHELSSSSSSVAVGGEEGCEGEDEDDIGIVIAWIRELQADSDSDDDDDAAGADAAALRRFRLASCIFFTPSVIMVRC